ncbi:formate hydrogenlyase [Komagataeibacter medellinensis]|uniref:NADH-ubiquinone oxidoreductase 20 kDa subunit n=2 Tax=Komagataeibacter medellinensis TaxID=1177712 RepID=G2I5I9_KOMMN|nr:formate hydrogenlyase [Komagataeibacter medellinensis]KAB8124742.1 formate hydrogenlyase [Komagataeibacter medellinensis]BAK83386.1 NADH-ubiquinone oxidoreductase 20 kDa subunit [Komagataeibacter medellinensis NBRC 3288]
MAYLHLFWPEGAVLPRMRALDIFHMDTGGCTGCGLELRAVSRALEAATAPIRFVSTPRQAALLLLTGSLGVDMAPVVEQAWQAMPGPRLLAIVGDCAVDGGLFTPNYAVLGGVGARAQASLSLPGCPPPPTMIVQALVSWCGEQADSRPHPA